MADVVSPEVRSRMMSGIRGKNTKPEIAVRKALFSRGFRYLLDDRRLPGRPDIVLPRHRAVIFVHGCFWHGHECAIFKWPRNRESFWRDKISGNRERDELVTGKLLKQGWRVATVFECAIRGPERIGLEEVTDILDKWIVAETPRLEVSGIPESLQQ